MWFNNFNLVKVEDEDLRAGEARFCRVTLLATGEGLIVLPKSIERNDDTGDAWLSSSVLTACRLATSDRLRLIQDQMAADRRASDRREREVLHDMREREEREEWKEAQDREKAVKNGRLALGDGAVDDGRSWKLPFTAKVEGGRKEWTQYVYVGKSLCRDGLFPVWAVMQSCSRLKFRYRVEMRGYGLFIRAGAGEPARLDLCMM